MEDNSIKFEELLKRLEEYGSTNVELLKLKAIDKSSEIVSVAVYKILVVFAVFLFSLVLSSGIALWLGELLGKTYYGVFVMSGVYGLVALLMYLRRDQIKESVCNSIITKAFN